MDEFEISSCGSEEPVARIGEDRQRRAQRALVTALIDAADYAGNLAEAVIDDVVYRPGELIRLARNTRVKSLLVLTAAVHHDRAAGHSWAQIAEGLGVDPDIAEQIYRPGYESWLDNDEPVLGGGLPAGVRTTPADRWPAEPAGVWAKITGWRRRRSAARVSSP